MRQTWWSPRAIRLHVVIIIVVPTFAALCLWQVHRALDGNQLSWAYVFEWPFFAGYAVYMWWRFLHEAPRAGSDSTTSDGTRALEPRELHAEATDDEATDAEAKERAAYNEYLSALATRGRRKQWR